MYFLPQLKKKGRGQVIINAMKKQKQEKRIGNAMEKREEMLFKISKVFLIGWH